MIEITDEDINHIEREMGLTFDQARRIALKSYDDVQACPGSGKTTMVAAKLLIIAKKWSHAYKGVCVLTHTNVAKNEIISALQKHPAGHKLLIYPHFIGTIQEFIHKHLAIPMLKSEGIAVNQVDDEVCCTIADKLLSYGARRYLKGKHVESLKGLQYRVVENEFKLNIPGFNIKSQATTYKELEEIKKELITRGLHFYGEMYAYSEAALEDNPELVESIGLRFPISFIDEMQDTQKFQDELLNRLFNVNGVSFQRFGDPDQAIYGDRQDKNESYNDQELERVVTSHRFTPSIASLAKNLSLNRIALRSERRDAIDGGMHTIFLVDHNSRSTVFESFAGICSAVIPNGCTLPIKAIGAVGKQTEDSLTICDYYPSFDKTQANNSFRPSKLIHYFYKAKELALRENSKAYALLLDAIVRCGQISDSTLTYLNGGEERFSHRSLKKYLSESKNKTAFNTILKLLLINDVAPPFWTEEVPKLLNLVGLGVGSQSLADFIVFSAPEQYGEVPVISNTMIFEAGGRDIKVDITTIHAVKGETHAATLVIENKFHNFDAELILDYILGTNVTKPTAARKVKFMKQFYVGFTRPKHLLCLAMDKSRFPEEHLANGRVAGWNVVDLTAG
jgi:DNA helicase-2/ATP-dependent DNA helicase PcrA